MGKLSLRHVAALTATAVVGLGMIGLAFIGCRSSVPDRQNAAPGFQERAEASGINFRMATLQDGNAKINLYDHGCGVAVGDFDGDGHDDIYFCNQLGRNALYRNKGDGTFEDVTDKAGVGLGDRVCVAAAWADYDNDGRLDLFVTSTRGSNVLFRNLGGGAFKDVTREAGVTYVGHSQTATFFDFDNDGYLDLFVTNSAKWTLDALDSSNRYLTIVQSIIASPKEYNILYRNNGDGTFTDVTAKAGLQGKGWGGDVAVFDYDGDGRLDLVVTNMFGATQLYHNNGDGTFTDVTKAILGRTSYGAIGCKPFDFNNDGRLDLFITDMHSDMWLVENIDPRSRPVSELTIKYPLLWGRMHETSPKYARQYEQAVTDKVGIPYDDVVFGNTFFKQLPGGKFEEVSDKAGLETWWPWGIVTGDFDNDGYEDVFVPSGMGYPFYYWPNCLLMNNGDETFTERAAEAGIEPPPEGEYKKWKYGLKPNARASRCAAVADFSGDGRLDLVVNNISDRAYYFRNRFPQKNYIAFKLTGTKSNRDAIGALVTLYMGKEVMVRQVNPAGGYLSQSSLTVHFGLGDRAAIDRADVRWPCGLVQHLGSPSINILHPVTEPNATAKSMP